MLKIILLNWCCIFLIMSTAWTLYLWTKNPGILDVFWPITILFTCMHYSLIVPINAPRLIVESLLIIWALRLISHFLFTRLLKKHTEKRYEYINKGWGKHYILGYYLHFQLQGILGIIIATPFLFIDQIYQLNYITLFISACILFSIAGETIADFQLSDFLRNNPYQVCNIGLWRFSRHPNLFFDWLSWLGFSLIFSQTQIGWVGFISPLLLLYLMLGFTIPITEKGSLHSRGEDYANYQSKTSRFIPFIHPR